LESRFRQGKKALLEEKKACKVVCASKFDKRNKSTYLGNCEDECHAKYKEGLYKVLKMHDYQIKRIVKDKF